jgi:hypothetical protein
MRVILLAAATLLSTGTGISAQAPRMRDSAGVQIIENGPRRGAPIAFRLADTPAFDLGGLKDNPDDEFDPHFPYLRDVELSDGTHVVPDGVHLRFYDRSGKQLRVVGRQGHGPHEFQQIASVCRTRGDTLVVNDPSNARTEILDHVGNFVGEIPTGPSDRLDDACLGDGSFVVSEYHRGDAEHSTVVVRRRLDGTEVDTFGAFGRLPFSIYLLQDYSFAATSDRLYIGDPEKSEVRAFDPNGKLVTIVRTADPIAKVTGAEADAMKPMAVGVGPGARPVSSFPKPTEWPAYFRVATDPDGRLWIEEFPRSREAPVVWTAFDRNGRMIGALQIPAREKPDDPYWVRFTSGGVQLLREDSDGARHISTYRLVPVKH